MTCYQDHICCDPTPNARRCDLQARRSCIHLFEVALVDWRHALSPNPARVQRWWPSWPPTPRICLTKLSAADTRRWFETYHSRRCSASSSLNNQAVRPTWPKYTFNMGPDNLFQCSEGTPALLHYVLINVALRQWIIYIVFKTTIINYNHHLGNVDGLTVSHGLLPHTTYPN